MRKTPLSSNMEDYLEAILEIAQETGSVRTKALADKLGVRQPSVTSALQNLSKRKLISYEPYGDINLTTEGKKIAQKILDRHICLQNFLHEVLDVEKEEADEIACRLEHVVSQNVMEKLIAFTNFMEEEKKFVKAWKEQQTKK